MATTLTLYGIRNCDTVKRARQSLDEAGIAFRFHDFKADGLPAELAARWIGDLGANQVINRRGTTWRKLTPSEQARADADPVALITEQHSLVKRPVWDRGGELRIGFAKNDAEEFIRWAKG